MSALDICKPQIISAVQKEGWKILEKPHMIRLVERNIFADFSLQKVDHESMQQIIVLEVKCFSNPKMDLAELYTAVGQCQFYRTALALNHTDLPVYLALPLQAYVRLVAQPSIQATFQDAE